MRIIIRTFFLTNKDNTVMQLTFSYKMTQINEVLILNRDFSLDLPICVAFLSDMLKTNARLNQSTRFTPMQHWSGLYVQTT